MLTNPEEFQHLPTADDDDHMAEPGAPLDKRVTPQPVASAEPELIEKAPEVGLEPAHSQEMLHAEPLLDEVPPSLAHEAVPEETHATAKSQGGGAEISSAVSDPIVSETSTPAPQAKPPPKTARVPVVTPAPAAPASEVPAEPKNEILAGKAKNKATTKVVLPVNADKDASAEHAEENAAHLETLKAEAKSKAEAAEAEAPPKEPWRERWEKWGGRSLAVSVGAHLLLLIIAAVTVFHHVIDKQVDFLPGGGSVQGQQAQQALQHKIQQKKNPWLKQSMPSRKIAVASSMNNLVLPKTEMPDVLDLPEASKPLGGGAMSGGFGLAGAGGGFGSGVGLGAKSGMVFGPLFGMNIKARKLALVMDVSYSMAPHLERVVKEVDKVAKGSVVILYFGCGLEAPVKQLAGTKVFRSSTVEFEKFWRKECAATFMETASFKIDKKEPIPHKELFLQLSRRPQTYFIHNVGVGYTWLALLSDEVRSADGLYWFSDFQDTVNFKQLSVVLETLQRRKQRLYIHSYGKGQYFDLIKNQLVEPTKGDSFVEE